MTLDQRTPARRLPSKACFSVAALSLAAGAFLSGCCSCLTSATGETSEPPPDAQASGSPKAIKLFDGKTLTGWVSTDFAGRGDVKVEKGNLLLGSGYMTGVTWTNTQVLPATNYEISLEAMRVEGSDFFCGLTFPVGKDPCSFIAGGWGGGVVGLSSIDGEDAANNETTSYMNFVQGQWYAIRVRVTPEKIQAWIDDKNVVDQSIVDRKISIRIEMEPCVPLGIATYATTAALRNIWIKPL